MGSEVSFLSMFYLGFPLSHDRSLRGFGIHLLRWFRNVHLSGVKLSSLGGVDLF